VKSEPNPVSISAMVAGSGTALAAASTCNPPGQQFEFTQLRIISKCSRLEFPGLLRAPNSDEAYRRLGDTYRDGGHKPEAIAAYQSAVNANPYCWSNHNTLGKPISRNIELTCARAGSPASGGGGALLKSSSSYPATRLTLIYCSHKLNSLHA